MTAQRQARLHLVSEPQASDETAGEIAVLRREVEGLRRALESRGPIEQAKGMLMMRYGIAEDGAFALLRRWSSEHNVKLRTVALTLVSACSSDHLLAEQDLAPEQLLHGVLSCL